MPGHCLLSTAAALHCEGAASASSSPLPRSCAPRRPLARNGCTRSNTWRAQLHLQDGKASVYGKNGGDLTRRFRAIAAAVERLPVTSAIIDAELVACNADAHPTSTP